MREARAIAKKKTYPSSASELRIEVRSVQGIKFQAMVVDILAQNTELVEINTVCIWRINIQT